MIKLTTKRDELRDEALREEGRREERERGSRENFDRYLKRERIDTKDGRIIPATELRPGDYLFEGVGIRGGHRGAMVTYVSDHYPDREHDKAMNGQPTRGDTLWVEYEADPQRGVTNSGGSLINADDKVLVVVKGFDGDPMNKARKLMEGRI